MNASKENCAEALRLLWQDGGCDEGGRFFLHFRDWTFIVELLEACRRKLPCDATFEKHHKPPNPKLGRDGGEDDPHVIIV